MKKSDIIKLLIPFCELHSIPIRRIEEQLCAIGKNIAILCVANPEAPKADGLANDIDTLMLPTLYVHFENGQTRIETTEYTEKYLFKAA